ncbi:MAG: nuclear transport factor 2 family protein [Psychrobium sp.]|nr:nuclear transport factor 2 family protein [Psychrobium sp.]
MNPIKRLLVIAATALVLTHSTTTFAKSIFANEYKAVVATANNYFTGMANGDQAMLAKAFDLEFGDAKMIRVDKDSGKKIVRTVGLKEFAGYFSKATKDTWQAKILSVDIVDNQMAMVKLQFDTPKNLYIDYLVMYKRNNEWRIVNKTFVATKK